MNVKDYIVHETERQSGTMAEAIGMFEAWEYAMREYPFYRPTETHIKGMVWLINGLSGYRKVPAVFNQGVPALEASLIPLAMKRLFTYIGNDLSTLPAEDAKAEVDVLVKEFLEVHPFADGNGRVASLLWNWLRGSLPDPEPMPYFFDGEPYFDGEQ